MTKTKLGASVWRARYFETLNLLERVHHQMITLVRDELDRRNERSLTSTQAILLNKIGERDVTASQLCEEEKWLGGNISYNLVKLTDAGYVRREISQIDRRFIRVRLTEKGDAISKMLITLFDRHLLSLEPVGNVGATELWAMNRILEHVEQSRLEAQCYHDGPTPESTILPLASAA